MTYKNIVVGSFVVRHNRFVATVNINGTDEMCHVKNTGRLRELLIPNALCFLEYHGENTPRKTKYSLVAVKNGDRIVNIDSFSPNKVFYEWANSGAFLPNITLIKPEKTYKNSRFDCYIERGNEKIFVEVKGVTLKEGEFALFPDAPTERGVKHLRELCDCKKEGYSAYIAFVCTMKGVKYFSPNIKTHKEFAEALKECEECGVKIICVDCNVTQKSLEIDSFLQVRL